MKKALLWVLALLLLGTACGQGGGETPEETPPVDLAALYAQAEEDCGWEEGRMADIEGDLLEDYYPGLRDLEPRQLVAKIPAMSTEVNELVFLECGTAEDAAAAAAILQERADAQAQGGAWYPESLEAWSRAAVMQEGVYAALVASQAHQETLTELFQQAVSAS